MSDTGLMKDLYYTFGKNFLRASIVYLPKNLLLLTKTLNMQSVDWSPYLNKVFILEENGDNYFVKDEIISLKISQKMHLLEDNIIHLLKLKAEFLPVTFTYVLKKYMHQLAGYMSLSEWLVTNAPIDIVNLKTDHALALNIQNEAFKAHSLEVVSTFEDATENLSKSDLMNESDTIEESLKIVIDSQQDTQFTSIISKEISPLASRSLKLKNIKELTMNYADELILKQVFNLDIKTIRKND